MDDERRVAWVVDPDTMARAGRGEVCEHCLMELPKAGRQKCIVNLRNCPMETFSFLVEVAR